MDTTKKEIEITPETTGIALAIENEENNTDTALNIGDLITVKTCCVNQYKPSNT